MSVLLLVFSVDHPVLHQPRAQGDVPMCRRTSGLRLALAMMFGVILAACAGEQAALRQSVMQPPSVVEQTAPAEAPQEVWELGFADPLLVPKGMAVDAPTDPKALVMFALTLVEKQEFQQAASFFLEAADLPSTTSLRNEFRLTALAAAASCYLQAGDLDAFRRVVQRLRDGMDRFQAATLQPELAVLLAIAAQGDDSHVPATVPLAIKHLFHD
jgi:hypothetical protein